MALGGVDPSIVRELSGVYKPFVKAFKELVSNAFDADADNVVVDMTDDFSSVSITDDGEGMTPYEFRNDFTRIGGGSRRWSGQRTRKGRPRIGSKGIGFLAMARYCSALVVQSHSKTPYKRTIPLERTPIKLDLEDVVGLGLPAPLLEGRITCSLASRGIRSGKRTGIKGGVRLRAGKIHIDRQSRPVELEITVDCAGISFEACLDFDRLLMLADQADLEKLAEFAVISISEIDPIRPPGTRITAQNLKSFVRRELRAERRKGYVRNVSSRTGLEKFVWNLSRCTPVPYATMEAAGENAVAECIEAGQGGSLLSRLLVKHGLEEYVVTRPVYPFTAGSLPLHADLLKPVTFEQDGLKAKGFVAGYEGAIFPAEYRGIAIRVRGVAIGDPTFVGADKVLTGAQKAALSQITGEINILSGLDAVEDINPGRESFYDESEQYKMLARYLVGDGEQIGGIIGQTIAAILRRSQVNSAVKDLTGRASTRRRTLDDISAAITYMISSGEPCGDIIREALKTEQKSANGLSLVADMEIGLPPRIGGLLAVPRSELAEAVVLDYQMEQVIVDVSRREWDWTLLLFNDRFRVINKKGKSHQPIGEIDFQNRSILLNWSHPVRNYMDEASFLRMALAWVVAKEVTPGNGDIMMDVALKLLSYRSGEDNG
jgi:hypothetical protein